jgi:hypothetical protein
VTTEEEKEPDNARVDAKSWDLFVRYVQQKIVARETAKKYKGESGVSVRTVARDPNESR